MIKIWRPVGLAAILPLMSSASWGLGLGDINMRSYLNEPLRAEIQLLDVAGLNPEDIRIRLATQDDFNRLGVERAYFLTSLQFTVEVDAGGRGRILMTTEQPLLEPYLDFIVETRWPSGRLLREYTVLVDLPTSASAPIVATARQAPATTVERESPTVTTPAPAPAAAPAPARPANRQYDAGASERPASGGQYLVQQADTLWAIAERSRPAGVSVEQMMLATVDLNPRAFAAGNINGLKAGYVLQLPSEEDIRVSQQDATSEANRQNSDWQTGVRTAPALRVVADEDFEILPEEELAEFSDSESGSESGAEASSVAGDSGSEDDAAGQENLAAMQSQLGDLSNQIESLRELVSVKDAQIAELQQRLAEAEAEQASPMPEVTEAPPAEQSEAAMQPAVAEQPAPTPAATQAAPRPSSGFMGLAWWMWGALGLVVAALLGLLVVRRSRDQDDDQPTMGQMSGQVAGNKTEASTKESASTETVVGESADPEATAAEDANDMEESGERGYGKRLYNEYAAENPLSDAIAEADIYIAYGRYQQALDLLNTALANDPGNASGHLKMLDIYLKTDRLDEARALLAPLRQTGDESAIAEAEQRVAEREAQGSSAGIDLGELAEPIGEQVDASSVMTQAPDIEPEAAPATDDDQLEALSFDLADASDDSEADVTPGSLELDLEMVAAPTDQLEDTELTLDAADADDEEIVLEVPAKQEEGKLPPELAEVLGTDIAPAEPAVIERDADDELVYASEADPMDTKLDLARAYLDMGDEEGARPVLEEVIEGGDLQQQAEARELLLRIE